MGLFDVFAALFGGGPAAPATPRAPAGAVPVRLDAVGTNKIAAIKVVREATGLGLKASKDLVESAPVVVARVATEADAHALVAALRAVGARASTDGSEAAPPPSGQAWVTLRSAGANPILVIKAIREATGLGLAECKALADKPSRIGPLSEEGALTLWAALIDAQADASIG